MIYFDSHDGNFLFEFKNVPVAFLLGIPVYWKNESMALGLDGIRYKYSESWHTTGSIHSNENYSKLCCGRILRWKGIETMT